MANAKTEDAQAAWDIFKQSKYTASLEHVNGELARRGFGQIKERTYTHLRKLARYGYDRYVPTNQLDVETLRDPVWDTPLRSRYLARRTDLSAVLVVVHGSDLITVAGRVLEASDLEAIISLRGVEAEDWIGSPRKVEHRSALLMLGQEDEARPVVVESVVPSDASRRTAILTVRFLAVVPPERLSGAIPVRSSGLGLTVRVEDSGYFLNSVRALNVVVAALESVRIGCDEALHQLAADEEWVLPPLELRTLNRENPLQLVLWVSDAVVAVFVWLLRSVAKAKVDLAKADAVGATAAVDTARANAINEMTRRQRILNDVLERASAEDQERIAEVIIREMTKALPEKPSAGDVPASGSEPVLDTERLRILIEKQILPSIAQLYQAPVSGIDAESEVEVPSDELWDTEEDDPGNAA